MIEAGFERIGVRLFGTVPVDDRMVLPSRHLGLVQAGETAGLSGRIDGMANVVGENCDLGAIAAAAGVTSEAPQSPPTIRPPGQRIAIARDDAFAFLYPHLADGWRSAGAELSWFSPIADEPPPSDCDACWLLGGYPELHAGRLGGNRTFLDWLRAFARSRRIHGECGGYMMLGRMIRLDDVGHWIQHEASDRLNAELLKFLDAIGSRNDDRCG